VRSKANDEKQTQTHLRRTQGFTMSKFGQRVKHLVGGMIPPALFFFLAFQLLALTQALMLRQYDIDATIFVAGLVGALVVAKVVVLAEMLPFINRFPERPLIWNIAWKTTIFFVATFLGRYIEKLVHFYRETGDIVSAHREMAHAVIWSRFWLIQIWLMVLLLVFCTMGELTRALGRDRMRELFFGISGKAAAIRVPNANKLSEEE